MGQAATGQRFERRRPMTIDYREKVVVGWLEEEKRSQYGDEYERENMKGGGLYLYIYHRTIVVQGDFLQLWGMRKKRKSWQDPCSGALLRAPPTIVYHLQHNQGATLHRAILSLKLELGNYLTDHPALPFPDSACPLPPESSKLFYQPALPFRSPTTTKMNQAVIGPNPTFHELLILGPPPRHTTTHHAL